MESSIRKHKRHYLLYLLAVAFLTIGAILFVVASLEAAGLTKNEPNECLMTYMSPQYLQVPFESKTNEKNNKRYELYLYRERHGKNTPAAVSHYSSIGV